MEFASLYGILLGGIIETFQPMNILVLLVGLTAGIIGGRAYNKICVNLR